MTDWVNIANSAVAPKAPVTSELVTALRDNTVVSTWEFYETVYDAALDGSISLITTPNFEDGWEYGFRVESLGHSAASGDYSIHIGIYDETSSTWFDRLPGSVFGIDSTETGSLLPLSAVIMPRLGQTSSIKTYNDSIGFINDNTLGSMSASFSSVNMGTTGSIIRNFRFSFTDGSVISATPTTKGKILMYRRKENISDA